MKKLLFTVLLAVAPALYAVADDTLSVSNMRMEYEMTGASSEVVVDFPLGNDSPLRRAVIDFILECLQSKVGSDISMPANTCDKEAFKKFLNDYTHNLCRIFSDDQQEYAESLAKEGEVYDVKWFSNIFIHKAEDTDLYVSYIFYYGEFLGGAHDMRGSTAVTFRKSDGQRITDIFKEEVGEEMQPLLWKYYIITEQPDNEEAFVKEIGDFLEANYGCRDCLHLSGDGIYLAPDGVHLVYDPLEICFWPGEPEIIIPYEDARPFMTKAATRLISGK